ncbi:MAG: hypothetical protein SNJ62_11555, partial [Chloracidobacterium sp.]
MSEKLTAIVDQIGSLTLLEAAELVKLMEAKFGVSAAAAAVAMPAAGGAAAGAPAAPAECSGRLAGAEMARIAWERDGRVPLHT